MTRTEIETLIERLRDKNCCDATACNCDASADALTALLADLDAATAEVEHNAAIAIRALERATLAEEWRDRDKTRAEAAEAEVARLREALGKIKADNRVSSFTWYLADAALQGGSK